MIKEEKQTPPPFWYRLINIGVSDNHLDENEMIKLYNLMSIVTITGTIFIVVLSWFNQINLIYTKITIAVSFLYFLVLFLNFRGYYHAARLAISIGSPLWISILHFLIGGFFCQGAAITAAMAITYLTFENNLRLRNILLAFNVVAFFISICCVHYFGTYWQAIDFYFDEIIVFIGAIGWTTIVFYQFDKNRTELLAKLKEKNQELVETTEELERFTYIASHDLKSPLRTIISFIGLIEKDLKKGKIDNIEDRLSFVKTGAKQMNFLVQDILELSKLKNITEAERSLVDLNQILEKAKMNLWEEIESKNVMIQHHTLPTFCVNELEFLLLFQNFIQNGIKYNESEIPIIQIESKVMDDTFILSFSDNGIGIEEKYFDTIFEYFKRLHTSQIYQGTGLGLGVCKNIITSYEGEVKVESTMGEGTTFILSFPIKSSQHLQLLPTAVLN
ncbi:MAG: ATP-binding protein [Saprospiraceae bacterium]